jgi:hypothetical protein
MKDRRTPLERYKDKQTFDECNIVAAILVILISLLYSLR